ncbi:MAG: hypothetical protein HY063_08810 [Bacteroidetes bacterium]|nr:hypothetical protein [Bacteroidota bacterium]
MKKTKMVIFTLILAIGFSSCTLNSRMMREPNARMEWKKDDFTFSAQVTGEATSTKIIGIDFARLFKKDVGSTQGGEVSAGIPIIGPILQKFIGDKTVSYAIYDMMQKNQGYDVILYPSVEIHKTGIPIIYTTTKAKVAARLGKLK